MVHSTKIWNRHIWPCRGRGRSEGSLHIMAELVAKPRSQSVRRAAYRTAPPKKHSELLGMKAAIGFLSGFVDDVNTRRSPSQHPLRVLERVLPLNSRRLFRFLHKPDHQSAGHKRAPWHRSRTTTARETMINAEVRGRLLPRLFGNRIPGPGHTTT